jgi:hypothetical protein
MKHRQVTWIKVCCGPACFVAGGFPCCLFLLCEKNQSGDILIHSLTEVTPKLREDIYRDTAPPTGTQERQN